jgi:hypothetical protein
MGRPKEDDPRRRELGIQFALNKYERAQVQKYFDKRKWFGTLDDNARHLLLTEMRKAGLLDKKLYQFLDFPDVIG